MFGLLGATHVNRLIFDDLVISTFSFYSPATCRVVQETSPSTLWHLVHLAISFCAIITTLNRQVTKETESLLGRSPDWFLIGYS